MTVIVAVADGTRVLMGADGVSTSWEGGDVFRPKLQKVLRKEDPWGGGVLVGVSGSMPHLRAIEGMNFALEGAAPPKSGFIGRIAKHIWQTWRDDWDMYRTFNEETAHCRAGCALIVGWEGAIYLLDTDGTVSEDLADYICIGSGEDPARGAMYATAPERGLGEYSMQERVMLALQASHYHRAAIQPPFQLEVLEPTG